MTFNYNFVTGEVVNIEVEVDEAFSEAVMSVMEDEKKNERRETRRHQSLFDTDYEVYKAPDNTERDALRNIDADALRTAVGKLDPDEQFLINRLYLDLIPAKQAELAAELGIEANKLRKRVFDIKKKLRQLI